jgi:hypothetical protein
MTTPYFGPPVPAYTNPPIEPQDYAPNNFIITNISLGATTTVTTATTYYGTSNNFVIGQLVRLVIPSFYRTIELNEQTGYVIAIPGPNQVTLNINSTNYTPFDPSPTYGPTPPQISAIGDVNTGQINTTGRTNQGLFVPGSFINVSIP